MVITYPFLMQKVAGRFIPLWMQNTHGIGESLLLRDMCYGRPISKHQTLEGWMMLEPEDQSRRVNMVGLSELLKQGVLPPGDDGEAVLYDDGAGRCAVWADSVGAAKGFILSVLDYVGMESVYASIGQQDRYKEMLKELE